MSYNSDDFYEQQRRDEERRREEERQREEMYRRQREEEQRRDEEYRRQREEEQRRLDDQRRRDEEMRQENDRRRREDEERNQLDAGCYISGETSRMSLRAKIYSGQASFEEVVILKMQEDAEARRKQQLADETERKGQKSRDVKPIHNYVYTPPRNSPNPADEYEENRKAFVTVLFWLSAFGSALYWTLR